MRKKGESEVERLDLKRVSRGQRRGGEGEREEKEWAREIGMGSVEGEGRIM